MEPSALLAHLFDKKKIAVLKQFIDHPEREFTLVEIAKSSRVSTATTFRILQKFVAFELIKEHKVKHLKTYSISDNTRTKYFERILESSRSAIDEFIALVKDVSGIIEIILHGKRKKDRADMLIIGKNVDYNKIQSIVTQILERYKFSIVYLILDPAQYSQMLSMGLYSGVKEELYKASI